MALKNHRSFMAAESGQDEPVRASRWSSSNLQDQFPVFDPATDRIIAQVQGSGLVEVDAAVSAAKTAFERDWRWRSVAERSRLLHMIGSSRNWCRRCRV